MGEDGFWVLGSGDLWRRVQGEEEGFTTEGAEATRRRGQKGEVGVNLKLRTGMGRFDGQVGVVVGGGSDIGLGVAMRMGREGASIVLVEADRVMGERAADLLDAEGIEGRLLVGDPADPAAAKWAATTAKLVWGRVDVVVYADPMGDVSGPLHAVGPKVLDALYRNDVRGPLQYCQAVIPAMMERGYGRIVTVGMDIGLQGGARRGVRSATQAAMIGLTKAVAMSVVGTGILVNAVAVSDGVDSVEGVVSTVCWLASGECSFTTGAVFEVGGEYPHPSPLPRRERG